MSKAKTLVKSPKPTKAAKPDFPVSVSAHGLSLYEIDGKPYAMDVEYGTWSGLKNPETVRLRIRNNWNELQTYGPIFLVKKMVDIGSGAEREVETYYLNEDHTLLLTMLGRTKKSAEFRKLLIEVFKAWRDGKLVSSRRTWRKHSPSIPVPRPPTSHGRATTAMSTACS
jgi:hypothetical protein